ncbi:MAG TPA: DUF2905 domain-containing protein [Chloroflexota bacterium]|nr:DUF2905 domain-containing protein [Chloroflexota bacterium]
MVVENPGLLDLGRVLIIAGGLLVLIGVAIVLAPRIPFLGRLPGDILFQRDGVTIAIPLATSILLSLVLTVLLNLLARIFNRS